jgi:hypothetical protein
MKDPESLAPENDSLPYWAVITRELDELGLTKAEFRIVCHIARRQGKNGVCNAGIESIARWTRTHPVYVRWVLRHLIQRKLVIRTCRAGRTNYLRLADKFEWLNRYGPDADQVKTRYEETAGLAQKQVLWARVWETIPNAPKSLFEARMKEDPQLFEAALDEVENRVKRGNMKGPDRLSNITNPLGYFHYIWETWKSANGRAKK